MLGLVPFLLKILMDVKVTMRKTVSATDRPTKSEKSVAIISSCLAAKSKKACISNRARKITFHWNIDYPSCSWRIISQLRIYFKNIDLILILIRFPKNIICSLWFFVLQIWDAFRTVIHKSVLIACYMNTFHRIKSVSHKKSWPHRERQLTAWNLQFPNRQYQNF